MEKRPPTHTQPAQSYRQNKNRFDVVLSIRNSSDAEKCPFLQLKEPGRRRECPSRGSAGSGSPGTEAKRSPGPPPSEPHRPPSCPGPAAPPSRGMKERWRGERWRETGREEAAGKLRCTHLEAFWMRLRRLGAAGASRSPGRAAGRAGPGRAGAPPLPPPLAPRPAPPRPRRSAGGEAAGGAGYQRGNGRGDRALPLPAQPPPRRGCPSPETWGGGGEPSKAPLQLRLSL